MSERVLVIDANRLGYGPWTAEQSKTDYIACPKWRAVNLLAKTLEADLCWRSPLVDADVLEGYDALVFNRVLPDINQTAKWLKANPKAALFHVSNDYSVMGGSLYVAARELGRPVYAIANYQRSISKVGGRMAADWLEVNLNTLVYEGYRTPGPRGTGCVYYGACRWGRRFAYSKYLTGHVTIAAHQVVVDEFRKIGVDGTFYPKKIQWHTEGLSPWANSLYLEDSVTPDYSPYLSNRFYEAIAWGLYPVFVDECRRTIRLSGYDIPPELVVQHPDQIPHCETYENQDLMQAWRRRALAEQETVLNLIRRTVRGG